MSDCEKCKYAEITHGKNITRIGFTTLIQDGKTNIRCTNDGSKSISFFGDEMICSGWEKRDNE